MSAVALDELLDEDKTLDPVTADGLSNHLTMGLVALSRLGATDDRLRRFATGWRARLVPRRPARSSIASGDWAACLGTGRRYNDLLAYFTEAIDRDGVEVTLDGALGHLLDGLGGAAFHGVIRLAYAIEHGRPDDIACGLAYLADVYTPVSIPDLPAPPSEPRVPIAALLSTLAAHPELARRPQTGGSFAQRFGPVTVDDSFCEVISRLVVDDSTLAQTAAVAHALYRATGDFFALHTVTATHAARVAISELRDDTQRRRAVGAIARSVAAAYVAIGTPPVEQTGADHSGHGDVPAWSSIADAAIASDDVHVIKMAYSCREEQAAWGDPLYQSTAAAVAGLIAAT